MGHYECKQCGAQYYECNCNAKTSVSVQKEQIRKRVLINDMDMEFFLKDATPDEAIDKFKSALLETRHRLVQMNPKLSTLEFVINSYHPGHDGGYNIRVERYREETNTELDQRLLKEQKADLALNAKKAKKRTEEINLLKELAAKYPEALGGKVNGK